jgi:hypothetical protein
MRRDLLLRVVQQPYREHFPDETAVLTKNYRPGSRNRGAENFGHREKFGRGKFSNRFEFSRDRQQAGRCAACDLNQRSWYTSCSIDGQEAGRCSSAFSFQWISARHPRRR